MRKVHVLLWQEGDGSGPARVLRVYASKAVAERDMAMMTGRDGEYAIIHGELRLIEADLSEEADASSAIGGASP